MARHGWRFPPERRHALKEANRENLQPDRLLDETELGAGDTAIDVGTGTGFWAALLSPRVGETGSVYAVDVEPIMLDEVRTLIEEQRLSNVQVVQSEEARIPLDGDIADLIVLAFVLHEPPDPDAFLREMVRLLKPDGRVLVIDWVDRPTDQGPPLEARISQQEALALLGEAGLTAETLAVPSEDAYVLLAHEFRPGDPEVTIPTI
jgi:ubiquinone/menaquinone biosynthesis C-methylase UbiE